jgi:hypothetical protein
VISILGQLGHLGRLKKSFYGGIFLFPGENKKGALESFF